MLDLESAIKHAEEVAEENEKSLRGWKECINRGTVGWSDSDKEQVDMSITRCSKCAAEHRQLAEWLKDYKRLKEQESKTGHWIYKIYGGFHEQGDWYCSHCDYQFNYGEGHAKHCPECGYEMSEAPTEEVMSEYDKRRCNYPNDI